MDKTRSKTTLLMLSAGIAFGLAVAWFWPHEPALAIATDRDTKFVLATVPVTAGVSGGVAGIPGPSSMPLEAIFVLDLLTGRLQGTVINNRSRKFQHAYYRNVAADFQVDPQAEPHYAIVGGTAQMTAGRGVTPASGVIYVGELTSGRIICYSFPYAESNRPVPPIELTPLDIFQFREAN